MAAFSFSILYKKGSCNGQPDALSRRSDYLLPPLPSLPILSPSPFPPGPDPLFFTPHLLGAAVLLSPNDPLLPAIATAQAGDAVLSALINSLQGGPYIMQHGLLYSQGRILIPPTSVAIILRIL